VLLVDTNMANVSAAKNAGLFASHGSVLSEFILDKIELEGIGRMLALTSNDEVNALAALYFTERFGRSEVYQLPPSGKSRVQRHTVPQNMRGRILFTPDATYEFFEEAFEQGATIESVLFSDSFSYDMFMAEHRNSIVPLFVIGPGLELTAYTETNNPEPIAGQRMLYLSQSTDARHDDDDSDSPENSDAPSSSGESRPRTEQVER
jgi:hypothetical protein